MKKMRWYKNNKGSSLLFVVISMAFVAIIGTLLSQLTVMNIQMKKTDRKAKETFYTNETALNELQIVLEDISGEAMKKAYVGIVNDYANITNNPSTSLQEQFNYEYVKYLVNYFTSGTWNTLSSIPDIDPTVGYAGTYSNNTLTYEASLNSIKTALDNKFTDLNTTTGERTGVSPSKWFKNIDDPHDCDLEYFIDNLTGGESYVILRNIKVSYDTNADQSLKDDEAVAHESTITTDMKFTVPSLSFQSGIYPKYTDYAIIANKYLDVGADNLLVDGNIYGSAGIQIKAYNTKFTGPRTTNIITRGNFYTYQGRDLTISGDPAAVSANDCVRVWADNFGTSRQSGTGTAETKIDFTGDIFVQDDLVLDANTSTVTMSGNNYFGFGYNRQNKSYTELTAREKNTDMNSRYSSAIVINGTDASLNMSGMLNLKLAGRAYISRAQEVIDKTGEFGTAYNSSTDSQDHDIMTGEAVSIKSNQIAYLLPGDAIAGGQNPIAASTYINLVNNNKEVVDTGKLRSVKEYLAATPYTTYCYNLSGLGGGSYVYFYYNFKSQDKANQFLKEYFNSNRSQLERNIRSNGYINNSGHGVNLSSNIAFLSAACTGNIFNVGSNGSMTLQEPSSSNNPDGSLTSLLGDAIGKAKEYYSMQLELNTESNKYPISGSADTGAEFRLNGDTGEVRSQDRPIYSEIVSGESQFDLEGSESAITENQYGFKSNGSGFNIKKVDVSAVEAGAAVYCVYPTDGDVTKVCDINMPASGLTKGIILAACNVRLTGGDFEGMIITKGDLTIGAVNTKLTANTQLVQQILAYGQQSITDPKQTFAHYFGFSNAGVSTDPTTVDISEYISYSNWKNE